MTILQENECGASFFRTQKNMEKCFRQVIRGSWEILTFLLPRKQGCFFFGGGVIFYGFDPMAFTIIFNQHLGENIFVIFSNHQILANPRVFMAPKGVELDVNSCGGWDDVTETKQQLASTFLSTGDEPVCQQKLGGGNSNIFLCSPLFGEDFQFDEYFSDGLKPPTRK